MQYAEQPTPPFNSPYQTHASRSDSLLEPPYLSPSRTESMSKYPQGLGIYGYHHQVPTTLPPSPSPSDSWSGHISTGASPLMTQAIADPYLSGAFDHPIARSPQPWNNAHLSPRSSASSVTMVPVYSHAGSDHAYQDMHQEMGAVRLENHGWTPDTRYGHNEPALPSLRQHPLTVAPERLNSVMHPYDNAYGTPRMARLEPTSVSEYENQSYGRPSRERSTGSVSEFPGRSAHRERGRSRRQTDPARSQYRCHLCPDKGFQRQYNYKQHLLTHDDNREKNHVCPEPSCRKAFVRKTDLTRHNVSVHLKEKEYACRKCSKTFARNDTCRR